jgi:protein-S-isoprenylcysteine O-methyltransferase Ste14
MRLLRSHAALVHHNHPLDVVITVVFFVTAGGWEALEISLVVRDRARGKGTTDRDRGTRLVNFVVIVGTLVAAGVLTAVRPLRTPAPNGVMAAGVLVMWSGLGLRLWSISVLGQAFRTTVEVDPEQHVVRSGPYRLLRHPSYTGLLVIVAGFGLGLGDWLSLAVCLVVPSLAIVRRIRVEETEMVGVLGDAYRDYQSRTKRLIPLVW